MAESIATSIRRTAMDLLARREHSRRELRQKLVQRFSDSELIDSGLIDSELERLCNERLQSDERYAEVYLHSRAQRLYGPLRIKAELRERGIADDIVAKVFLEAAIDWRANLRQLELNKFGRKLPADMKEKAKRIRFFQYRGFTGVTAGAGDDD